MKNIISKQGIVVITNRTLNEKKPEVVQLMQYYGMNVNEGDSPTKINLAFLSLVPRSRGFRKDFSSLATQVAENMPLDEVELNAEEFLNFNELKPRGIGQTTNFLSTDELKKLGEQAKTSIQIPKKETKTMSEKTAKERKAFGDTRVGELLTNETVQNLINAGLQIYTYKKIGGAPQGTTNPSDNIINSASVPSAGGDTPNVPSSGGSKDDSKDDKGKGTDATKIILYSVGGLALIGTAFYFFTRNK